MNEATKVRERWKREGIIDRYITGKVLDIGCGEDKIVPQAVGFDRADGDAQYLKTLENESFDTVFSSHTLEHMRDPLEAVLNWWRVLRPGGFMVIIVPDEDLYEQGLWPSPWNPDHKFTYTISKSKSWSPTSRNLITLLSHLPDHKIVYIKTLDQGFDYDPGCYKDQTLRGAEAAIEAVIHKHTEQLTLYSGLKDLFRCPDCEQSQLRVFGITKESKIDIRCYNCGWTGTCEIPCRKCSTNPTD
jgi:hypothetical protein